MKKNAFLLLLLSGLFAGCKATGQKAGPSHTATPASGGFVVVELFTSEGCSSCPPADAVLAQLSEQYNSSNVLLLEEHVDYWDRLGWKDPFSKALFSERQNEYASRHGSDNVYTPQAVVNGVAEMNGAAKSRLEQAIEAALQQEQPALAISLQTTITNNTVAADYKVALKQDQRLSLLLIEKSATSIVQRGENGGRTLTHHQVVRDWRYITSPTGHAAFILDRGQNKDNYLLAALVQDADGRIIGMKQAVL
jgi:hypothetical protein